MATLGSEGRSRSRRRARESLLKAGEKASVVAVILPDGSCPAEEFLEEVRIAQFDSRIEAYCAMGSLRTPIFMNKASSDKEKPTVWEIKADKGPGYRLYGVRLDRRFVATHGGRKRKSAGLKQEVERARAIYREWQEQQ